MRWGEDHACGDDSIAFSGGVYHHSSTASRGEAVEVEEPVVCMDFASFDFHTTSVAVLACSVYPRGQIARPLTEGDRAGDLSFCGLIAPCRYEEVMKNEWVYAGGRLAGRCRAYAQKR